MDMKETPQGLVIGLKVKPNSKAFRLDTNGVLEIRSPPREGKANQEIIKELGRLFKTEVKILRGHRGRCKVILLKNIKKGDVKD